MKVKNSIIFAGLSIALIFPFSFMFTGCFGGIGELNINNNYKSYVVRMQLMNEETADFG